MSGAVDCGGLKCGAGMIRCGALNGIHVVCSVVRCTVVGWCYVVRNGELWCGVLRCEKWCGMVRCDGIRVV